MSSNACHITLVDFAAGIVNFANMKAGNYTYGKQLSFKTQKGVEIDITADDFEMVVYDTNGTPVDTLTIGDGLTIVPDNKLIISFRPAVTANAGLYTYEIVWTRTALTLNFPAFVGKITIKP